MKSEIAMLFVLINVFGVVLGMGITSELTLHLKNDDKSITIKGDQCGGGAVFNNQEVSCACTTGLWMFYQQDCTMAHVLLGATNGQCFKVDFRVHKASLISPSEETPSLSSVVVLDEHISSIGGKFVTEKGIPPTTYFVPPGFPAMITTGQQAWRVPHKKICIKPYALDSNVTNFCLFQHSTFEEFRLIDEDCFDTDEIISPLVCTPYLKDETGSDSCVDVEVIPRYGRVKRDEDGPPKTMQIMGRVFLDAAKGLKEDSTDAGENAGGSSSSGSSPPGTVGAEDADENSGLNVTIERPIINSEIWNFMTYRAQVRLGIRETRVWDKTSLAYSPSFEFLELAKKIQQKACPNHYVTDEHYDIAIGAFESLQRNHLSYTDSFLDFATSERIMDALNACLNNITTYPFLPRIGKGSVSCNGSAPITHGSYEMFDKILELSLGHDQASRSNEPIVETVWKVFIHAHSACFPFFKNSYNDHHRFTTVMLSLFTNDVNDMWFSVTELTPDIYTGFLGDAVDLMDSVAYCAMFSRLDSSYPWDLPRPKKNNARRKREVSDGYSGYECMEDYDARNVCPIPDRSQDDYDLFDQLASERNNGPSFMTMYK